MRFKIIFFGQEKYFSRQRELCYKTITGNYKALFYIYNTRPCIFLNGYEWFYEHLNKPWPSHLNVFFSKNKSKWSLKKNVFNWNGPLWRSIQNDSPKMTSFHKILKMSCLIMPCIQCFHFCLISNCLYICISCWPQVKQVRVFSFHIQQSLIIVSGFWPLYTPFLVNKNCICSALFKQ